MPSLSNPDTGNRRMTKNDRLKIFSILLLLLISVVISASENQASSSGTSRTFLPVVVKSLTGVSTCFQSNSTAYGCIVSTVAGTGSFDVGDGGAATSAVLREPYGVLVTNDSKLYIADTGHHRLRLVTSNGVIQTVAGIGYSESSNIGDGGPASQATLRYIWGADQGADGSLYLADTRNYRVRRILPNGTIVTIAGIGGLTFSGEGGLAIQTSIGAPNDVVVDSAGNIFIAAADPVNRILKVDTNGVLWVVAGTGQPGSTGDGGPAREAKINSPRSLAFDNQGSLLFTEHKDGGEGTIRKVDLASGIITTLPGLNGSNVDADSSGNIYFSGQNRVWRQDGRSGQVIPIAGDGSWGFTGDGGPALQASFRGTTGVSVDNQGNVYVVDTQNDRVRRIGANGIIETVAGGGIIEKDGPAFQAIIEDTQGIAVDRHGNVFFSDFWDNKIRGLRRNGVVSTVAGVGVHGCCAEGEGGHPLDAFIFRPRALTFDSQGNLLFIDHDNSSTIRMITPGADGIINGSSDERLITIVGKVPNSGQFPPDHGSADGGPAREAVLAASRGFAIGANDIVYVTDWQGHRIRKVVPGADGILNGSPDEIITTIAGNGVPASTGDGGPALAASVINPQWAAVDSQDNLYFLEADGSGKIRRISAGTGIITTYTTINNEIWSFGFNLQDYFTYSTGTQLFQRRSLNGAWTILAGTGAEGFSGDGGDALVAAFRGIGFFAFDANGDIYTVDNGNFRMRKVAFMPLN